MPQEITFDTLLKMCQKGKIQPKVPQAEGPFKGAINGGSYLGAPGKDIYFFLPRLTDEQFDQLVEVHSHQYPMKPPGNHVGNAACIRYIYGQFEKQGTLRSKRDRKRMQSEGIDWDLSRKFISILRDKFIEQKHCYGLTLLCEMEAHRLGDEAILLHDDKKLNEMEKMYVDAVENAHHCGSHKHMFTPYYWAARYFMEMRKPKKALRFARLTLEAAERHCPDSRKSYIEKLLKCAKYMMQHDANAKGWLRKFAQKAKNKPVRKMLIRI